MHIYQRLLLLYYYNKHTLSTKRFFYFTIIIIITSFDNKIVEPNVLDGDQATASNKL